MRFHCGQIEARRSRDSSRFITTAWLCRTEGAASRTTRRIAFAVVGLAALSGMFRSAERSAARGVPVSDHVTVRIRRWLCPIKSRWRLMKRGHASWGADPARLPVPGRVSGAVRRSAAMSRQMSALALMLILLTIGLLVAPSTFHRIAQDGQSTGRTHGLVGCFTTLALLPLAAALGLDLTLTLERAWGQRAAPSKCSRKPG